MPLLLVDSPGGAVRSVGGERARVELAEPDVVVQDCARHSSDRGVRQVLGEEGEPEDGVRGVVALRQASLSK